MENMEVARTAVTAGFFGLLGRMIYWAHSKSHPIGWSLIWEVPTALGMGWIGLDISDWLNLGYNPTYAVTISVSYIGPRLIDMALLAAQRRIDV